MLTCPNDQTDLKAVIVEGVTLEQCTCCGGYWFQHGELETLAEHHHAHLKPITVGRIARVDSARKCPVDKIPMRQHEFEEHSGIKIDQCPTCQGIWLETTGLVSVLGYLEEGVHTQPTLSQEVMLFLYQLTKNPPLK